jgi:multiple sugar transport system substrate-binding protein
MTAKFKALACGTALAGALLWAGAAAATEITWWSPNWGQARAEKLVKDYEAAHPGDTIKLVITVAPGLPSRVETVLRSGTPPDLIDISGSWNTSMAATGKLLALDDFAAKNIDMKDLLPGAVDSARYDGKLYGLPYRAQSLSLIYNKKLYKDAGLDPEKPPQTWDEMTEVAKKLTRKTADGKDQYGFGIVGGGEKQNIISRLLPFIWMNGGDILSEDGTKVVVDNPAVAEALDFYTRPYTKDGTAPPSTLQNDGLALRRLFDTETIAMYLGGQFDLPAIQKEAPGIDIGVGMFPHPEGKEVANILSGWNFVVPADSPNHEATLQFLKFLMQSENQGFYTDTFPAAQSAMSMPRFQDPLLQPFKEVLKFSRPSPSVPVWVNVIDIMYDQTQQVLLKQVTPEEAVTEAASEIEARMQ